MRKKLKSIIDEYDCKHGVAADPLADFRITETLEMLEICGVKAPIDNSTFQIMLNCLKVGYVTGYKAAKADGMNT